MAVLRTLALVALVAIIGTATALRFFAIAIFAGVMLVGFAFLLGACGRAAWRRLRHGGTAVPS